MTGQPAVTLLTGLRRRGAHLAATGDHIRIDAPKGLVTPDIRDALVAVKSNLLERLQLEEQILQMPLSEFEREGRSIELEVPGLRETLWFVPGPDDAALLVARSVRRGRIWTAAELQELMSQPGLASEDAISLARVRIAFDATVVGYGPTKKPAAPLLTSGKCHTCHGTRFWRSADDGHLTCGRCHPPADDSFVAWIEVGP